MKKILVDEGMEGQRLNKLLGKYLDASPKSFIYKMLRKKNIKYNHKKATGNEIVKAGDIVEIFMSDDTIRNFRKDGEIPALLADEDDTSKHIVSASDENVSFFPDKGFNIIYEDGDVLILNKPIGELSQKAKPSDYTLNERIVDYYRQRESADSLFTPSVCNRLDRNTSGIILAGMSLKGTQELSRLLKQRELDKYYITVVSGKLEEPATVKGFLVKKESHNQVVIFDSKEEALRNGEEHPAFIETYYEPLAVSEFQGLWFSLLKVKLITGKTHQIRAHLDSIGHSIVGDGKYGLKSVNAVMKKEFGLRNQLLHAYHIKFPEDNCLLTNLSGKDFYAELPDMFSYIITEIFTEQIMKQFR